MIRLSIRAVTTPRFDMPDRATPVVLCLLFSLAVHPGSALAQDAGNPVPDAGQPQTDAAGTDANAAPSGDDVSPSPHQPHPTSATSEVTKPDGIAAADTLVSEYGFERSVVESLEKLVDRLASLDTEIHELESRVEAVEKRALVVRAKREGLLEQSEDLTGDALTPLAVGIARRTTEVARVQSHIDALRGRIDRLKKARKTARRVRSRLEEDSQASNRVLALQRERARKAKEAERKAMRAVRRARRRERRERNKQLKKLLARQSELAEERLAFTKEHNDRIRKIRETTRRQNEAFATRKADLLGKVTDLPASPSADDRRQRVDPVFRSLIDVQREVKRRYFDTIDEVAEAAEGVESARDSLRSARTALSEERRRRGQLDGSELWRRRVETSKALVDLRKQKRDAATAIRDTYQARLEDRRDQLYFIADTLRELLPRISAKQYDRHFALFDDGNWDEAIEDLRWRVHGLYAKAKLRAEQADELPEKLLSLKTWGWLGGLFWRLLVVAFLVRLLFPALPKVVEEITDWLLERQFFRLRPAFTVKLVEILGVVARLGLLYFAIALLGNYVAASLTEVEVLLWVIDAVFIYWLGVEIVSVLVVPRRERVDTPRQTPEEDLLATAIEEARAAADLAGLQPKRAEKFMRSTRVVLAFWILAAYLPDFAVKITGPTVLWYILQQVATWGFVVIVYWVLSAWRDDISAIFERLAGKRMARAVQFVDNNKDKPWGVLVIGLASVYVIAKQLVRIVRKYVLNTQWFQKASNFAYRKSIELQQPSADDPAVGETPSDELPPDYLEHFADTPIDCEDECRVDRRAELDKILDYYDAWETHRRQGSVALVGEAGVGRTTLLEELADEFASADGAPPLRSHTIDRRLADGPKVLDWLASLFGLEQSPDTVENFVELVREMDRRIVVLDDCQHLFMKRTGGFDGLETLLDVVSLTDETHFWILSFNNFAWSYINRIRERSHYFGRVLELAAWSESEIRQFIERRNRASGYTVSFSGLDGTDARGDQANGAGSFVDVVQSASGYFRYLTTFSAGNPRVALVYWLRSLRYDENTNRLYVSLFHRPRTSEFVDMDDDYWFVLTALAQHGQLDGSTLARCTNIDEGFCVLALNYFQEKGIVEVEPRTGRARLSPLYFRQVLRHLSNSNFLYG